jgi:hypothetical protein
MSLRIRLIKLPIIPVKRSEIHYTLSGDRFDSKIQKTKISGFILIIQLLTLHLIVPKGACHDVEAVEFSQERRQ